MRPYLFYIKSISMILSILVLIYSQGTKEAGILFDTTIAAITYGLKE